MFINTKNKFKLLALILLFSSCQTIEIKKIPKDYYSDFYEFSKNHREGIDYKIEIEDKNLACSVFAIHGGKLEKGTSKLAKEIARDIANLYIFNSLMAKDVYKSHITSTKYNEIRAIDLAKKSSISISIHAMREDEEIVCIGGLNKELSMNLNDELNKSGFTTEYPCKRLPGISKKNIVNLSKNNGVQLEISAKLIEKLDKDPNKLLKFINSMRAALMKNCD